MSNVLDNSYNMAMLYYKQMKSQARMKNSNIVQQNMQAQNLKAEEVKEDFNITLEENLSQGNISGVKYSGEVKALKNPKIQSYIKQYRIDEIVEQASKKFDISENLIYKVIETESYFDKDIVSSAGAVGLMQLMPFNFATYGVTDATDPYQNIMAGTEHLKRYIDMFDGDLKLGLAAYNAGPGNVKKYGGVPPFKETQNYIKKILGENV